MEIRADMRIISDKDLFAIGTVTLGGILRIQNVKVLMLQREGEALRTIVVLPRKSRKTAHGKRSYGLRIRCCGNSLKNRCLRPRGRRQTAGSK